MNQLPARFQNRQNRRTVAEAAATGLGSASPPYVSIKGGSFTLVDGNGEQDPIAGPLDCVIIDTNAGVSRVFWGVDEQGRPKPYDPNADTFVPPVCFSDNGIGASRNAAEPQSMNCSTCRWNVWGSATSKVSGKGVKACQATKKIAVLVPEWEFPFLLRVPVMSHENLRAYSAKFQGQEFDVSDVMTRVIFVHGQVGELDFQALGFTDDATEAMIDKILTAHATDGLVGRGDVAVQPPPRQETAAPLPPPAPAAPQPAPQAAPFAPAQQEPPKQKRTRKAAAPASNGPAGPFPQAEQPADAAIPPFLRREQPAAPGIQQNAPAPNPELNKALESVFGLKT
jgi:hypothetical protein